jgi:hypothetical protein
MALLISTNANPTTFAQFNNTGANGQTVQFATPFFSVSGEGEKCWTVDMSSLGIQGLAAGTNATLQVVYQGGDGALCVHYFERCRPR